MLAHSNLSSLFSDIADAIREKTGNTNPIVADDFPNEIANIQVGFPSGTKWTASHKGVNLNNITNANGVWVAAADDGLYYSKNGTDWEQSNVTREVSTVHYANGVWVAAADDGLYYSKNGIEWTQSNTAQIAHNTFLCNANGVWVAGFFSKGIYYSNDGMEWTQSNITEGAYNICNANGIWHAEAQKNAGYKVLFSSADGKTWESTAITMYGNTTTNQLVHYANGVWVANGWLGAKYGSPHMLFSYNGVDWLKGEQLGGMGCIYNANGIWVCNAGGTMYYSTGFPTS